MTSSCLNGPHLMVIVEIVVIKSLTEVRKQFPFYTYRCVCLCVCLLVCRNEGRERDRDRDRMMRVKVGDKE